MSDNANAGSTSIELLSSVYNGQICSTSVPDGRFPSSTSDRCLSVYGGTDDKTRNTCTREWRQLPGTILKCNHCGTNIGNWKEEIAEYGLNYWINENK